MHLNAAPSPLWQLPPCLSISSGPLQDDAAPLMPAEQASVGPMTPGRLAEFSQGREHARLALQRLGLAGACIPAARDRSSVWPDGFTGSISHVPANPARKQVGHVMAVVARLTDCSGLGVDLERTDRLLPEHWRAFMTVAELGWLAARPVEQRNAMAHGLWSAKEAVTKALRQPLDPQDIDVQVADGGATFVARCRLPGADPGAGLVRVAGWLACADGWVAALAAL